MSNPGRKRPAPLSIRLSEAERRMLAARAGRRSLSGFIKQELFGDAASGRRAAPSASLDQALAGRILAVLGQSRVFSNLNQIAKAAHTGSLLFDEETRAELREACAAVRQARDLLMRALGKVSGETGPNDLQTIFTTASRPEGQR